METTKTYEIETQSDTRSKSRQNMPRTITVTVPLNKQPYRPSWMRALGVRLHPEVVTTTWYAADCPPNFRPESLSVRAQWVVACLLRGARR